MSAAGITQPLSAERPSVVAQTTAIFIDAYRESNARKMFWISLIISGMVVGVFALIGFDDEGFSVGWKHFKNNWLNTRQVDKATLYQGMFVEFGVNWWLTWIAVFLALLSTAGVFPEFISGGTIDLYLSKPIARLRLFLTKYLASLMFVALQVTVFCIASFLVIGTRGGVWAPGIFVAIPLVLMFFSFLYCVCVLVGVLTGSTLAALLLTILFWFGLWAIHSAEVLLLTLRTSQRIEVVDLDRQVEIAQRQVNELTAQLVATSQPATQPVTERASQPGTAPLRAAAAFVEARLDAARSTLQRATRERAEMSTDTFTAWHRLAYAVKWPLPKTSETYKLIERALYRSIGMPEEPPPADPTQEPRGFFRNPQLQRRAAIETEKAMRDRSLGYVLGTSIGFEAVVLALTAWIFCRRDF